MKQLCKYLSAFFISISLVSVVGCAASPKHESTGQYMDDKVITVKVKEAIFDEPTLKVFQIKVITFQGVVQLSGFVNSQTVASKAVDVARRVEGVKSVKDDMEIK
ncbi:BON domain-containing protein [Andreprevotia chitinilytica]|uniref:BON domain-containing protein n=1 Tax=Andreprevotia chitinilytica TaxID=396808 RepID=UPI0005584936|nr:BON domain-containing protein [Andreprevotia chitinilytica]